MSDTVHILGCGRFGRRALEYYAARPGPGEIVLIDTDESQLEAARRRFAGAAASCRVVVQEADRYLAGLLVAGDPEKRAWIIPTVPFHLAFAALCRGLERAPLAWPELPDLPNLFHVSQRCEVCSSLADFVCPADCPQPRTHCYHTGRPRDPSLLKLLARLDYRLKGRKLFSLVLASSQVAPGLGGFPLRRLRRLFDYIQTDHPEALLFSTACRCHGVTNILGPAASGKTGKPVIR